MIVKAIITYSNDNVNKKMINIKKSVIFMSIEKFMNFQMPSVDLGFTAGNPILNQTPIDFLGVTQELGSSGYALDLSSSNSYLIGIRLRNIKQRESRTVQQAQWENEQYDWRVRLSIPPVTPFNSSPMFEPLRQSNDSLIWPYTPLVTVSSNANYSNQAPTHNNYTYPAYENSNIETISISGEFSVENPTDAKYWVAANHFLRSVSKMFYGESSNIGAPPPVLRLNGYGDFVFNNVPVVLENFIINLPKDVDYIKADVGSNGSWAPTLSEVTVSLKVAYSRNTVNSFSLDTFVQGGYLNSDGPGFI